MDTDWKNIPVPLHEAVILLKEALEETQTAVRTQAEEIKLFWDIYG